MDVSFAQLTVGGRGRIEFEVTALDPQALTASLAFYSAGNGVIGTATVDLAGNTATIDFDDPLMAAKVELLSQVFEPGDVVMNEGGQVGIVFSFTDGQVFFDPFAQAGHPSHQWWRVGSVDLTGFTLP